jgi:predicted NACHT family NTPase
MVRFHEPFRIAITSKIQTLLISDLLIKNQSKLINSLKSSDKIINLKIIANSLLLTLLCLVFAETGEISVNHPQLYKQGLGILLKKWDNTRIIERDQVYWGVRGTIASIGQFQSKF